ncbi:MAG: ABC transporter permease subunit [Cypionkella sp.]
MSIANVLVLSSVIVAVMKAQLGLPLYFTIPAALDVGLVVGAINGFLITYFRIHSLIVTIGTGNCETGAYAAAVFSRAQSACCGV